LSGTSLTPEDGSITVQVSVVVPSEKNKEFNGTIKVVNTHDPTDYAEIHVYLKTPMDKLSVTSQLSSLLNMFAQHFPVMMRLMRLFS
jgi:hypothetical protein